MTRFIQAKDLDGHTICIALDKITGIHEGHIPKGKDIEDYIKDSCIVICGSQQFILSTKFNEFMAACCA